ncbi:MAG: outer membrane beta-barrel protein [Gammaproteobacteria bacterium]|nr:outer membrane beta-barrel protein [Gammaproteobacteria bacterium]MCW5583519.1 outer membrane beta-barrel protein [Gammaproteobacteria bacterium]
MRMQRIVGCLIFLSIFCISDVYARQALLLSGWFAGVGAGAAFPSVSHRTDFACSGMPGFPDDKYVANNAKNSLELLLTGGYQWQRDQDWLPAYSLGLQYAYAQPRVKGVIYVNNLPDTRNFNYRYDVDQHLIMLNFKADIYRWNELMPFLAAGVGVAINNMNNYSDSPIAGETIWNRRYGFTSGHTTQFAESIGAGLDYWLADNLQASLGYQYACTGNVRSGHGEGSLSADRLTNQLSLSSVDLQLVYFFS